MTKLEFVASLRSMLSGLPEKEVEDRISFYIEMMDDRIEDGLSEEEAVLAVGSVDDIASQIVSEIPLAKIAKEKIRHKRKLKTWEIVLLALGSPLWLVLLSIAFVAVLSIYIAIWSVDVSLWAVFVSLVSCAVGGIAGGILFTVCGNVLPGIALIGVSIVCAGLSIFLFFGCKAATKGLAVLTKKIALGIKKCFVKKEEA